MLGELVFTDLSLLWIGAVLTALILVGVWSHGTRRRRLAEFLGGQRALARLARKDLSGRRIGRVLLLGLAGICLGVAAAEPRWVEPPPEEPPPPDRVVFAIDVSASMQATDVSPTRLARAVEVATDLLEGLGGQEVGLMIFAGTSYTIAPPTLDHDAIGFLLSGISPTMASAYDPGTLLSAAIADATALLDSTSVGREVGRSRVVIFGDGEAGEPESTVATAAAAAQASGVEVHAVGVGTDRPTGMSLPAGTYQLGGPVTNLAGERAVTRMREPVLRDLARATGGRYAHSDDGGNVRAIGDALTAPLPIDPLVDVPEPPWADYDLPFILGVAALALILLESLLDASLPRLPAPRARRVA